MAIVKEFREFALKGNVVDLAVGVVIGAAFGGVVKSFTDDILMPPIGLVLGKHDFSNFFFALDGNHYDTLAQAKAAGAATLNLGLFVNNVISFLIIAFAIFLVVKWANRLKRAPKDVSPTVKPCPECLSDVPIGAKRCKFCSSPIPADGGVRPALQPM